MCGSAVISRAEPHPRFRTAGPDRWGGERSSPLEHALGRPQGSPTMRRGGRTRNCRILSSRYGRRRSPGARGRLSGAPHLGGAFGDIARVLVRRLRAGRSKGVRLRSMTRRRWTVGVGLSAAARRPRREPGRPPLPEFPAPPQHDPPSGVTGRDRTDHTTEDVPVGRRGLSLRRGQARSNRSRFMTLSHAATKSRTNFSCASSLA